MPKIYKILVTQQISGELYIEAANSDEARDKARALLQAGTASLLPNTFADTNDRIEDVYKLQQPEIKNILEGKPDYRDEGKNLIENKEALEEIIDDEPNEMNTRPLAA